MKTHEEVRARDTRFSWLLSLNKILDKHVTDLRGYITQEFGEPMFEVIEVVFEDGSVVGLGGEHDIVYLENYNEELYQNILDTDPDRN